MFLKPTKGGGKMILSILLIVLLVADMMFARNNNYKAVFYTSLSLTVVLVAVVVSDFMTGHFIMAAIMAACLVYIGLRTLALRQYR